MGLSHAVFREKRRFWKKIQFFLWLLTSPLKWGPYRLNLVTPVGLKTRMMTTTWWTQFYDVQPFRTGQSDRGTDRLPHQYRALPTAVTRAWWSAVSRVPLTWLSLTTMEYNAALHACCCTLRLTIDIRIVSVNLLTDKWQAITTCAWVCVCLLSAMSSHWRDGREPMIL